MGSHVCELLARGGEDVVCMDVRPFDFQGDQKERISVELGDVANFQSLLEIVKRKGVREIVTAAAIAGTAKCAQIPLKAFEVNVLGLANALECARIADLNLVYVSSNSVYGKRPDLRLIKETDPMNPDTVYRRSKALGEEVCQLYVSNYGLRVNTVRLGVVYGPRLPFANKLTYMLHCALSGQKVAMPDGAEERVDQVYVKDVAKGIVAVNKLRNVSNRTYNIASGESQTLLRVATTIQQIVNGFEFEIGPGYLPDGGWAQGPLDISRARAELGYEPTPMAVALEEYIEWIKANPAGLNY